MIEILKPQTHEEWLQLRATGIGSSDVGTILGVNPFDTPFQLWLRKTGKAKPKEENFAMRLGHILEPAVAELYEQESGNKVDKTTEGDWCAKNSSEEFLIASPDRICFDKEDANKRILLECKTTRKSVDVDNIPASWFCQVQYLMYVLELDRAAIAWLKNGQDFGYKHVLHDKKFCEFMLEKVRKFWFNNIKQDKAPEAINGDDIALKYPMSVKGKIKQATDELRASYDRLQTIQQQLSELTAEKESIIDAMKIATSDAEQLCYGDKVLGVFRGGQPTQKTFFDEKRFKAENKDLYAHYTTVVDKLSSRSFYPKYE